MTRRVRLVGPCCVLLLVLTSFAAIAQKAPAERAFRRFGPDAIRELSRDATTVHDRTRAHEAAVRALKGKTKTGAEEVATKVFERVQVELKKEGLRLQSSVPPPMVRLGLGKLEPHRPIVEHPEFALRAPAVFQSIVRRDEIVENLKGRVIRHIEARAKPGAKSKLEEFLERDLGLQDYVAVAASFDANVTVKWVELPPKVTLLRLFGGNSGPLGRYLFCCLDVSTDVHDSAKFGGPFAGWTDARGLATPPENTQQDLAVVQLPEKTRVLIGTVADNFVDEEGRYQLGGNTQIFCPSVKNFPYERYRLAGSSRNPQDIVVVMGNGRVGRFRP